MRQLLALMAGGAVVLPSLVAVPVRPPTQRPPTPLQVEYLRIIDAYRRSQFGAAITEIRTWSERNLTAAVHEMSRQSVVRSASTPDEIEPPVLAAAIMVHTEAKLESILEGATDFAPQLTAALSLTLLMPPSADERLGIFTPRNWYLAVAQVLNGLRAFDEERRVWQFRLRSGSVADLANGDVEMLIALGSMEEGYWLSWERWVMLQDSANPERSSVAGRIKASKREAERRFRAALEINSGHLEARLRLGRVQLELGKLDDAASGLQTVLAAATDRRLVYLASLFLGRTLEERGQLDQAAACYEKATAVDSSWQTARIALSSIRERLDDADAARAALLQLPTLERPRGRADDPWWDYTRGQYETGGEMLNRFRSLVLIK